MVNAAETHSASTREKLLDVAERLFAQKSIEGVSIRSINSAAGLSPGILHYHFGNKESLIEAIIVRRINDVEQRREALYSNLNIKQTPISALQIACLIVQPLADFATDNAETGGDYIRLISRLYADRSPQLLQIKKIHYETSDIDLPQLLTTACPDLPDTEVKLRLGFAEHLLLQDAIDWLPPALQQPSTARQQVSFTERVHGLISFISAGLSAKASIESLSN
ncbi:MAG: TetR/AcrR family transcriptional regulator [Pseudomonadales bacterium]